MAGGGSSGPGGGNNGGAGTYTYPQAAGGTGGSGGGTGSGTSGSGSGSGTSGRRPAESSAVSGSAASGTPVAPPVASTVSGSSQSVTGTRVQGLEGVSGVPLKAAAGAQAPQAQTPGPRVSTAFFVGAVLVALVAFFAPWPIMAARLRRITGFDHSRPKRYPPFRPLG